MFNSQSHFSESNIGVFSKIKQKSIGRYTICRGGLGA